MLQFSVLCMCGINKCYVWLIYPRATKILGASPAPALKLGWLEVEDGLKPILLRDLTRLAKQRNLDRLMLIGNFMYRTHR